MTERTDQSCAELLKRFNYVRTLFTDPATKTIAILGSIDDKDAIITFEKTHFTIGNEGDQNGDEPQFDINQFLKEVKLINSNDIYYWAMGSIKSDIETTPATKLNLVWPATEVHIKKYDDQIYHLVRETPEMYKTVVKPYIESMRGDRLQWVKNILFNGAEADKILYNDLDRDNGFVLLPDMKWDCASMDSLYLVAICYRDDISSIRDLKPTHKDWLIGLVDKLKKVVPTIYPTISSDELRIFIHYQPSYYHFHIHVVNIRHRGLGDGISIGKAILLDDVIEQLDLLGPEGFENKTISYILGENHGLWNKLKGYHYKFLEDHGLN